MNRDLWFESVSEGLLSWQALFRNFPDFLRWKADWCSKIRRNHFTVHSSTTNLSCLQPVIFNIVACRAVFRQRLCKHFQGQRICMQQYRCCWKWCFLRSPWKAVIRRTTEARIGSWKGAAVQRGLEHGSRGITVVRSRHQETSSKDTASWKRLSLCCNYL
jgi:hypothetical protein